MLVAKTIVMPQRHVIAKHDIVKSQNWLPDQGKGTRAMLGMAWYANVWKNGRSAMRSDIPCACVKCLN